MRKPKKLAEYTSAEQAARGLEALAADIRRNASGYPLVRWTCNIAHWNPAWETNQPPARYRHRGRVMADDRQSIDTDRGEVQTTAVRLE